LSSEQGIVNIITMTISCYLCNKVYNFFLLLTFSKYSCYTNLWHLDTNHL